MINADSVKARLKNQATKNGRLFRDELVAYCLERTIYRISISKYNENFTLKGGIFLYAIFEGEFSRATRDIDLLARELENEVEAMRKVFEEIFAIESDDAIKYKAESLSINTITEFREYQGINIKVMAMLDNTAIPVSIDIGFGDVVLPERVMMDFPVLLEMDAPQIYAYSLASVIAEKFEAIVSLGYANSRYKDFYDIYLLSNQFDFDSLELSIAIMETFKHRKTMMDDIVIFEKEFSKDRTRNMRWKSFISKKRAMMQIELTEAIDGIESFLSPVIEGIRYENYYVSEWKHKERIWRP
ncbi:MAG: nucleotidyl transferase AbiEii/AbiGii toxin family protein [Vallitaleaceae bacterium]|nr:nucleotidyl transferase AbiEii/AbiGii toxin family protein [Vallitaleaceae bacterium]